VGHIENMEELYSQSHALIFPSLSESLGLPLLEASLRNLPIVASEKDFVRDSVVPVETFDPLSHVSIARSVMRFMKINENHEKIHNTKDIIDLLIS
jgi:glycosyltransferase involved in cell wall biosynthesis